MYLFFFGFLIFKNNFIKSILNNFKKSKKVILLIKNSYKNFFKILYDQRLLLILRILFLNCLNILNFLNHHYDNQVL